jgi:hypothetical protein
VGRGPHAPPSPVGWRSAGHALLPAYHNEPAPPRHRARVRRSGSYIPIIGDFTPMIGPFASSRYVTARSKSETAPIPAPLQELADTPIIALAGLIRLAEWIQAQHPAIQGGDPCHTMPPPSLLPAPVPRSAVDARSTLGSADGPTTSTHAGHPQQPRDSTTRRASRRTGGAR